MMSATGNSFSQNGFPNRDSYNNESYNPIDLTSKDSRQQYIRGGAGNAAASPIGINGKRDRIMTRSLFLESRSPESGSKKRGISYQSYMGSAEPSVMSQD